ncbi:MAG: nitrogen fixation protein NifU [Parcubacteria group bacterium Athens1014_26]|nr:MAG: nitrogen fixation protein NifU [Parcubacteria group bacterium Athens1014_26]
MKFLKNKKLKKEKNIDLYDKYKQDDWLYSNIVKDHFFHPRNFIMSGSGYEADGYGISGSPICGDMLKVWIKVDGNTRKIKECRWQTFGCASAIASTSMMSVMVTENGGMDLKEANDLKPQQILERLGGLPDRKFHCSVLGHLALAEAVSDYFKNHGVAQ